VRELDYRKTLELPLGPLATLAAPFGIADPLVIVDEGWRFRPQVSAVLPIYSGGQIPATQAGAQAQVRQANAELDTARQHEIAQLAQAYFTQQLAIQAANIRREVRDGLEQHLTNARRLEDQGFASHAQVLQAQVARDEAERELLKAANDLDTARAFLIGLLRADGPVEPTTPLFVLPGPIDTLADYQRAALAQHPQLARLQALEQQAEQGIRLQHARRLPQLYAFAQYDLNREDALLTDPDWVVGVGLRYTLLSGVNRSQAVRAARSQQAQVAAGLREAQVQIGLGVTKAFNDVATARQQFALLESSIAAAVENLRLQELSFREGQATSLDVIDARLGLGRARIQRAQAAHQYLMSLVQLLDISGQTERFAEYTNDPTRMVVQ
jgi:outer membrane protein TolC